MRCRLRADAVDEVSAGDLVGSVDRTVDLSQERFHTEYFDPLELRVQCATVLSTFVLLPVFFYAAVAMNPEVPIGAMRKRAAVSMAAGTLTVHACFVLFGAPAITAFFKTFALSVCIGAVVVVPLGCSLGGDVKAWQRVISHNDPRRPAESQFYVPAALTAFGAWLGAFPIPLDWDRPWQVWMRDKVKSVSGTVLRENLSITATSALIPLRNATAMQLLRCRACPK